jgi:hypothetical protein
MTINDDFAALTPTELEDYRREADGWMGSAARRSDADLVHLAARLLFGERFRGQLGDFLSCDDRLAARWASGARPVPRWVLERLRDELQERRVATGAIADALAARIEDRPPEPRR